MTQLPHVVSMAMYDSPEVGQTITVMDIQWTCTAAGEWSAAPPEGSESPRRVYRCTADPSHWHLEGLSGVDFPHAVQAMLRAATRPVPVETWDEDGYDDEDEEGTGWGVALAEPPAAFVVRALTLGVLWNLWLAPLVGDTLSAPQAAGLSLLASVATRHVRPMMLFPPALVWVFDNTGITRTPWRAEAAMDILCLGFGVAAYVVAHLMGW